MLNSAAAGLHCRISELRRLSAKTSTAHIELLAAHHAPPGATAGFGSGLSEV